MSIIVILVEKAQEELRALLKDAAQSMYHYILMDKEQPIGALMNTSEYNKLMHQNGIRQKKGSVPADAHRR